jgi:hypothetical protein
MHGPLPASVIPLPTSAVIFTDDFRLRELKESPAPKSNLYGLEKFTYVPEENCYLCPAGKQLKYVGINQLNRTHLYHSTLRSFDINQRVVSEPTCERVFCALPATIIPRIDRHESPTPPDLPPLPMGGKDFIGADSCAGKQRHMTDLA